MALSWANQNTILFHPLHGMHTFAPAVLQACADRLAQAGWVDTPAKFPSQEALAEEPIPEPIDATEDAAASEPDGGRADPLSHLESLLSEVLPPPRKPGRPRKREAIR